MKSTTRRNGKSTKVAFPAAGKGRWLPDDTTRPQVFADKRKVADKRACRGKVAW